MLEEKINQDLKTAMLAGDTLTVSTLRSLKSAIQYAQVATTRRNEDLSDDVLMAILRKEAQKRQESADLFVQGGNEAKAHTELAEKAIIEKYLPAQLDETEVAKLVEAAIAEAQVSGQVALGAIIGTVKQQTGSKADGATIARIVKQRLEP